MTVLPPVLYIVVVETGDVRVIWGDRWTLGGVLIKISSNTAQPSPAQPGHVNTRPASHCTSNIIKGRENVWWRSCWSYYGFSWISRVKTQQRNFTNSCKFNIWLRSQRMTEKKTIRKFHILQQHWLTRRQWVEWHCCQSCHRHLLSNGKWRHRHTDTGVLE